MCENYFPSVHDPTIEDNYRKKVIIDEETCFLDIFDTAGQEEYAVCRESFIKSAEGFLIVFSITSRSSFDEIQYFREEILRVRDEEKVPMVLVGNKCDICDKREVQTFEAEDLAKLYEIPFYKTSAKARINVEEAFFGLVREIRTYQLNYSGGLEGGNTAKNKIKNDNCLIL
eukprot:TRINITY_DN10810_c0_g3_i1.p1 TRINITY_DN10810_c0_g3~~TRINITY_DN10810_c0_g3_i1.p1  ORF type:complete len:172 (+),score=54.45 TRINITY_DN10810_c0_g3_i1:190-705(+)